MTTGPDPTGAPAANRLLQVMILAALAYFAASVLLRFQLERDAYVPLFDLCFNPDMYLGDLIRESGVPRASVFYPMLSYLNSLVRAIGEVPVLFWLFALCSAGCLWATKALGQEAGGPLAGWMLVFLLLPGHVFLPGAGVYVACTNALSQTPFGYLVLLAALLAFARRRYLASFLLLALCLALHFKSGFAAATPIALVCLHRLAADPRERGPILRALAAASPVLLLVLCNLAATGTKLKGANEFLRLMAEREGAEADILQFWDPAHWSYYFFYLLLQGYALCRLFGARRGQDGIFAAARQLIIAGNVGLVIGVAVSLLHRTGALPVYPWMLLAWPKLATLPTIMAFTAVAADWSEERLPGLRGPTVGFLGLAVVACLTVFTAPLPTLSYAAKYLGMVVLCTSAAALARGLWRNRIRSAVWLLAALTGCGAISLGYKAYSQRQAGLYPGYANSLLRPLGISPDLYAASRWLRENTPPDALLLQASLDVDGGGQYTSFRVVSKRAYYYTDAIAEVYGDIPAMTRWKARRSRLAQWEQDGFRPSRLTALGVEYLVAGPGLPDRLAKWLGPGGGLQLVYANDSLNIYRLAGAGPDPAP